VIHSVKVIDRGALPSTRHEAARARDDARALADELAGDARLVVTRAAVTKRGDTYEPDSDRTRRAADLLEMLHALLVERIERADTKPSGWCEQCCHAPDAFDYDDEADS
jgi:hypothetical protein